MASRWIPASVGGLLLGAALAFAPACGMSGASGTGDGEDGVGGAGAVGASGVGGSVAVNPDADQPPGRLSYGAYCGDGACSPSAPEERCEAEGEGGAGGGLLAQSESCKLLVEEGSVVASCGATGLGTANGPCQKAADCGPGLGCVLTEEGGSGGQGGMPAPSAGLCRPYCCDELEACPVSTFCALAAPTEDPSVEIPVCVPTEPCQLLTEGSCGDGEACTIVRADGTTSCAPAGDGVTCSACPCADGYVCAPATGTCHKLCRTDERGECGTGSCQGGALNTPSNIGICVGGEAECG